MPEKTDRAAPIYRPNGELHGHYVYCPACKRNHIFDSRWTFNGNLEKPTFKASMLVHEASNDSGWHQPRCHSFVTDGQIKYLGDCSHEMVGKTVDLPILAEVMCES